MSVRQSHHVSSTQSTHLWLTGALAGVLSFFAVAVVGLLGFFTLGLMLAPGDGAAGLDRGGPSPKALDPPSASASGPVAPASGPVAPQEPQRPVEMRIVRYGHRNWRTFHADYRVQAGNIDPDERYYLVIEGPDSAFEVSYRGRQVREEGTFYAEVRSPLSGERCRMYLAMGRGANRIRISNVAFIGGRWGVGMATEMIGPSHGIPFYHLHDELAEKHRPLLGVQFELGHQFNEDVIRRLEGVFDPAVGSARRTVVARPGYVVGGIDVDVDRYVNAMRLNFVRLDGDRLDPRDTYQSDWIGFPTGRDVRTISAGERPVIGLCGRGTGVIEALGLVLADE